MHITCTWWPLLCTQGLRVVRTRVRRMRRLRGATAGLRGRQGAGPGASVAGRRCDRGAACARRRTGARVAGDVAGDLEREGPQVAGRHRPPGRAPGQVPQRRCPFHRRARTPVDLPDLEGAVEGRGRRGRGRGDVARPAAPLRLGPDLAWCVGQAGADRSRVRGRHLAHLRPSVARGRRPNQGRDGRRSKSACGQTADNEGLRKVKMQVSDL